MPRREALPPPFFVNTLVLVRNGNVAMANFNFASNPFYRAFTDAVAIPEDKLDLVDMQGSEWRRVFSRGGLMFAILIHNEFLSNPIC